MDVFSFLLVACDFNVVKEITVNIDSLLTRSVKVLIFTFKSLNFE